MTLGPRAEDNFYQVLSGLKEGERVVTSGQFMLDSESQLREAIQKMLQPTLTIAPSVEHLGHRPATNSAATLPTTVAYICPMPEHVAIKYIRPGKCPLCSMGLVPVTAEVLARLAPGGKVLHYTCPMTEHAEVKIDQPGKCPKCSMTMIPVMQPLPLPGAVQAPDGTNSGHKH